jgi:hypothetical protein
VQCNKAKKRVMKMRKRKEPVRLTIQDGLGREVIVACHAHQEKETMYSFQSPEFIELVSVNSHA